jgi:hypothetical protein
VQGVATERDDRGVGLPSPFELAGIAGAVGLPIAEELVGAVRVGDLGDLFGGRISPDAAALLSDGDAPTETGLSPADSLG